MLTFIGIWYIEWGRRNAIASAFLGTSAISVLVVVLEKSGKCDMWCEACYILYILDHKAYTVVYFKNVEIYIMYYLIFLIATRATSFGLKSLKITMQND